MASVPRRRRMPSERNSVTHKFSLQGADFYLTVGFFRDGSLGEIFLKMGKTGSTMNFMLGSFSFLISKLIQHGVPLGAIAKRFVGIPFEPNGFTGNPAIPNAASLFDYVFRWLEHKGYETRQDRVLRLLKDKKVASKHRKSPKSHKRRAA